MSKVREMYKELFTPETWAEGEVYAHEDDNGTPVVTPYCLLLALIANQKGKFRFGYCSEYGFESDSPNELTEAELSALWRTSTFNLTENLYGVGGYVCGSAGPGWFSWEIGCTLSTGVAVYFFDDSFVKPVATAQDLEDYPPWNK